MKIKYSVEPSRKKRYFFITIKTLIMEQIQKLKAELEQVQKELRELCNKAWNKNHFKYYYVTEINKLSRKKTNLQTKINQLRQKNWYWG